MNNFYGDVVTEQRSSKVTAINTRIRCAVKAAVLAAKQGRTVWVRNKWWYVSSHISLFNTSEVRIRLHNKATNSTHKYTINLKEQVI